MKKRKHVAAIFVFNENVSQMLTDAGAFYKAISTPPGNTHVVIPTTQMATAQKNILLASAAEGATKTRTKGTADARDTVVANVVTDIRGFVLIVQAAANAAPDEVTATQIVTECGLITKAKAVHVKKDFEVKNDDTEAGMLDFAFKAAGKGIKASYEIQESTDGINFTSIKSSPTSRFKLAHGKAPGTRMIYRGRIVLSEKKGKEQAWITAPAIYVL